ncbi:type III secretion system needle filament subunit SctF [Candidatus Fukatsuia endosymbiont of Tuberolachnus salignus]|uniref:type III secretion system needle filament subunit SctF n=1 Tax=Candidatus Fukatsuia endosymbiont of Tuberolachnus salignus TaxID=3077957 RepID=UPI00313E5F9A
MSTTAPTPVKNEYIKDVNEIVEHFNNGGKSYLADVSTDFNASVISAQAKYKEALNELKKPGNIDSPSHLADYQQKLSTYTIIRNAQSNTIKALKDIDMSIVGNFR